MKKLFFIVVMLTVGLMMDVSSARGAPVYYSLVNENGESVLLVTGNAITGAEMIQNSNEVDLVAGVAQPTVIPIRTELITLTIITNPTNQNESLEGIQTKKVCSTTPNFLLSVASYCPKVVFEKV